LYACEIWKFKVDIRKLNAFKMTRCWKIMRICGEDMVSNRNIREDLKRGITVVDKMKDRKLQLFGLYAG
jgi:hypothetical protein